MTKIKDLTGKVFGRLTVVSRAEDKVLKSGKKVLMWKCLCECGNIVVVRGTNLKNLKTLSCGCYHKDIISECKHGHARKHKATRLYRIWCGMKVRCNNPHHRDYRYYGARGIQLCQEWSTFEVFSQWALTHGYADTLTIDRIDTDGNYTPSNCRWITRKEQSNNTRGNHYITFNDQTMTLTEWSYKTGIKITTLLNRLNNGWDIERALTTPTRKIRKP